MELFRRELRRAPHKLLRRKESRRRIPSLRPHASRRTRHYSLLHRRVRASPGDTRQLHSHGCRALATILLAQAFWNLSWYRRRLLRALRRLLTLLSRQFRSEERRVGKECRCWESTSVS